MAQERKINGLLLTLMRSGAISERLYWRLRSSAGKVPLLYGLPKVHKPGTPLRPIVSFVNSPTYALSKHLVTILSPLVGRSHSHVRNSFDFASFIAGQTLEHNMAMVSFDVVSLFTKVPVDLATKVAQDRLSEDTSLTERTSLSADEIVNLLRFCLDVTYLAYNGDVFKQIFGTAMGSPVSVTVANLVMEDMEERALSTCSHPPPFWKRYVDDTFTALPEDQVDRFLDHLNTVEPTIKFTMEKESNGSLSFLDTLVTHHEDGSLSTSVYRKKTHTDRYLDFTSHHPLAHKVAVARTLMTRAERICTFVPDRDKEKQHIAEAHKDNGYPSQHVNENWQPRSSPHPSSSEDPPKATVVIPYIRHLSESIRRILTPLKVRTCFRPHCTLKRMLVSLKDHIPWNQRAGVVYRIPCGDCEKVYIGQTGRTLEHRMKKHRRALTSGNLAQSALAEHAADRGHAIDWRSAEVVDSHQQFHQRCLLESWHIRSQDTTLNREEGNLPPVYNQLIPRASPRNTSSGSR